MVSLREQLEQQLVGVGWAPSVGLDSSKFSGFHCSL